ncbi:hypothetical protein BH23BAC1_BH23BAC1_48020 [soil metagenome]
MKSTIYGLAKDFYHNTLGLGYKGKPPVGKVDFGDLRRKLPLTRNFGYDRGGAIDRYFIESFLEENKELVKGRVLEIKDGSYAKKYGGDKITQLDILDVDEDNPEATIIADLSKADSVPSNVYDCIILTQTLQLIFDVKGAIEHCYRLLKPNGILLVTIPGITQILYSELGKTWHWSFSEASSTQLFQTYFAPENIDLKVYGNVLVASALLYGLSVKELKKEELDFKDPDYQVVITVKAKK